MNRIIQIAVGIVVVAVVAAACFYGGMLYGKGQTQTEAQAQGALPGAGARAPAQGGLPSTGQTGRGGAQNGAGQGGMLSGEVQSVQNGVMTITDSSRKQVQIRVTDTTLIQKQASIALTDLQKGETVFVSGSQGSDGSYTARSVQVTGAGASIGQPGGMPAGIPAGATPGAGNPGGGTKP